MTGIDTVTLHLVVAEVHLDSTSSPDNCPFPRSSAFLSLHFLIILPLFSLPYSRPP